MLDDIKKIENEILELRKKIEMANRAYYIDSDPMISDLEYDRLFDRLLRLEKDYPEFKDNNSPTVRVGSDIDNELPESEHTVPILSLDKCYNIEDLMDWIDKIKNKFNNDIEVVIEPKIDGAGVVLYYENGRLVKALTRGNGYIGNEISNNIKTIKTIPLIIDSVKKIALRGEVFIKKEDFEKLNKTLDEEKYSNPRNLASGSIRRQKSKETAQMPLNIFIYEGFYEDDDIHEHIEILVELKRLGFPLNDNIGFFSNKKVIKLPFNNGLSGNINDIPQYISNLNKNRNKFSYEIDGLVIKINNLKDREALGFTQHHPRWAIAFKFDAPLAETIIKSIDVQIGRGGRATPVANLEPVRLAGSVISRATLHNQDYIDSIGINEGDRVTISKRGDVIPAVEEVIEKGCNISSYKIIRECPICKTGLILDGAHLFCPNEECNGRLLGTLQYFASRGQMDIESLGDKTIEFLFNKGFIKYIPDIYEFDYNKLLEFEGYKEKKIKNIIEALDKSKEKDFKIVLSSLGLKDIGKKASDILVEKFHDIDAIVSASKNGNIDEFTCIDGIGEGIAKSIIKHFTNPKTINIIGRLKRIGLNFKYSGKDDIDEKDGFLKGTRWVITGSFGNYKPREKAGEIIIEAGGELLNSISSKTTHLLCGESPGSKLDKARELGVKIIDEKQFMKIIIDKKI